MKQQTREVSERVLEADFWRGAPQGDGAASLYKEWHHFVVFGDTWTLLFNLNLDGVGAGRVITILKHDGWHARVSPCRDPRVRTGRVDATFERAGMRFRDGRYEVWQHGEGVPLEVTLEPVAAPFVSHNIRLGDDAHLSWCLVPRLVASGWFERDGHRERFEGRLAYHDHNWGRFAWGGDFSWDWGCAVPDDPASPWTVIFARINDRARHRTTATSVFLLKHGRSARYFRNAEVRFETQRGNGPRSAGRVPAAAVLLLPDEDHDVARWTSFEARREDDRLRGEVEVETRGQVLVPSEVDVRRVVRLNEAHGRVRVEGRCDGEAVRFEGPALLEVVRG